MGAAAQGDVARPHVKCKKHTAAQEAKQLRALEKAYKEAAAAPADPVQAGIMSLVLRTKKHTRFWQKYNFASYGKGWTRTPRASLDDPEHPLVLLALDCEMCATATNDKELLQVAVVDQQGRQVMKELVRPSGEVIDYRTKLTGITAEQLQGVTTTRAAAAARIAQLLQPGTVLVGHSLHYDLRALQLDHGLVIDTALLFKYKGLIHATPSLTHLAEEVLGKQLRGESGSMQLPHDSVEDASAALALVKAELERLVSDQGPTPPLAPPAAKVDVEQLRKLCVHRLPAGTTAAAVRAAFVAGCKAAAAAAEGERKRIAAVAAAATVKAAAVEEVDGQGSTSQLLLAFDNPGSANEAFGTLPDVVFTDSVGRHSKLLQLEGGAQVVVRRMGCHGGAAFGRDKAQDRGAKKPGSKKRPASSTQPAVAARKKQKKRPAGSTQPAAAAGGVRMKQKKQPAVRTPPAAAAAGAAKTKQKKQPASSTPPAAAAAGAAKTKQKKQPASSTPPAAAAAGGVRKKHKKQGTSSTPPAATDAGGVRKKRHSFEKKSKHTAAAPA